VFPDDATVEVEEDDPELAPELTLGAGAKVLLVTAFDAVAGLSLTSPSSPGRPLETELLIDLGATLFLDSLVCGRLEEGSCESNDEDEEEEEEDEDDDDDDEEEENEE